MALQSIYNIQKVKSTHHSLVWKGWPEALKGFDTEAWVIATLHYGVFVGKLDKETILWLADAKEEKTHNAGKPEIDDTGFPDAHQIVELRIFDAQKEAYYWKDGSELKGRLRQDGAEGDDVSYTETNLYTRGVVARKLFDDLNTKDGVPLYITTRNYIGQNAIGQTGYVDCRFVEFKKY